MRNFQEYPITTEEIVTCLEELAADLMVDMAPGDMQPVLLQEAAKRILEADK